jgi:hypothetical protein
MYVCICIHIHVCVCVCVCVSVYMTDHEGGGYAYIHIYCVFCTNQTHALLISETQNLDVEPKGGRLLLFLSGCMMHEVNVCVCVYE